MDSDPETLSIVQQPLFDAVAAAGIEYAVSSAMPGRNCLLGSGIPVLNQSVRVQCTASPFLRITTAEDILESSFHQSPGWILGVMDAPVISFLPYIWQKGSRFMQIVDLMLHGDMINVLPHTLSRYACILQKKGLIKRVTQSKI